MIWVHMISKRLTDERIVDFYWHRVVGNLINREIEAYKSNPFFSQVFFSYFRSFSFLSSSFPVLELCKGIIFDVNVFSV